MPFAKTTKQPNDARNSRNSMILPFKQKSQRKNVEKHPNFLAGFCLVLLIGRAMHRNQLQTRN